MASPLFQRQCVDRGVGMGMFLHAVAAKDDVEHVVVGYPDYRVESINLTIEC